MGCAKPSCSPKVSEMASKTGVLSFTSVMMILRVSANVPKALITNREALQHHPLLPMGALS